MRHLVVLALTLAINTAHGLLGDTHWGCAEYSNAAPDAAIGWGGAVVVAQLCAAAGCNLTVGGSAGSTVAPAWTGTAGHGCGSGSGPGLWAGALPDCEIDIAPGDRKETVRHQAFITAVRA